MAKKIVCFGTHILDTVALPVDTIPSVQQSVRIDRIMHAPGGTAAGVAVDLAHLGFAVASVGGIGADATGTFLLSMMQAEGVDTRGVVTVAGAATPASILLIDSHGNRPALHARGASAELRWEDVPGDAFDGAEMVHFGGLDALASLDGPQTLARIRALRTAGVIVTVDFQSGPPHLTHRLLDIIAEADAFLPNEEQACSLTQTESVEDAARRLLELGPRRVMITCGADGIFYADQEGVTLRQPAAPTTVVDTTGCGDSVVAAYLAAQAEGLDIVTSLRLCVEAAATVAAGPGSLGLLPTWDELTARIGHRRDDRI